MRSRGSSIGRARRRRRRRRAVSEFRRQRQRGRDVRGQGLELPLAAAAAAAASSSSSSSSSTGDDGVDGPGERRKARGRARSPGCRRGGVPQERPEAGAVCRGERGAEGQSRRGGGSRRHRFYGREHLCSRAPPCSLGGRPQVLWRRRIGGAVVGCGSGSGSSSSSSSRKRKQRSRRRRRRHGCRLGKSRAELLDPVRGPGANVVDAEDARERAGRCSNARRQRGKIRRRQGSTSAGAAPPRRRRGRGRGRPSAGASAAAAAASRHGQASQGGRPRVDGGDETGVGLLEQGDDSLGEAEGRGRNRRRRRGGG